MDSTSVAVMKILHVLPELNIGGVERHVIDLATEQTRLSHQACVVSAGGRMEHQLPDTVERLHLLVHRKSLFSVLRCALQLARKVRSEKWQIIHAHSRVPAWIALFASRFSGVPFVVTAHVNFGTKWPPVYLPYRRAGQVICVSCAVQQGMKDCFSANTTVVLNGLDEPTQRWNPSKAELPRFLFVGRLSAVKGLQDVLPQLPKSMEWRLDVVGDGPLREQLAEQCQNLSIDDRVTFHGYREDVDAFMSQASCLLFPSYQEGMPLTLARAIQIGLPVLASQIGPVEEMCSDVATLLPVGGGLEWNQALCDVLDGKSSGSAMNRQAVPSLRQMTEQTLAVYEQLLTTEDHGSARS